MPTIHRFEDLIAWQKARGLSNRVQAMTGDRAFLQDYDLKRQLRRSAGSVMDNIAEGFGRGSRGEFIQFLGIARGSLTEVQSQLYRSLDNTYITSELFTAVYDQCSEVNRLINSLLRYLNTSTHKGRRYSQGTVEEEPIPYNFPPPDLYPNLYHTITGEPDNPITLQPYNCTTLKRYNPHATYSIVYLPCQNSRGVS